MKLTARTGRQMTAELPGMSAICGDVAILHLPDGSVFPLDQGGAKQLSEFLDLVHQGQEPDGH